MVTVTLQELMAQTNALPEDATLLELYADAAEEQIEVDINRPLSELIPEGGNWKDVPEELWDTIRNNRHSSAYRRLNSEDVSVTIDTGHMNYFHPKYNRVPTVRESARIQSFPDDFIFTGGQGAQFRQVGNAVPPLLSYSIAKTLKTYLNKH